MSRHFIHCRSEKEVAAFRASKEITVKGQNVPNPVEKFTDLDLDDNIMEDLLYVFMIIN